MKQMSLHHMKLALCINVFLLLHLAMGQDELPLEQLWVDEDAHETAIAQVSFSPDGTILISASTDMIVKMWDAESGEVLHERDEFDDLVLSLAHAPDTSYISIGTCAVSGDIVSQCKQGGIHVWDMENELDVAILAGHEGLVSDLAYSPDGSLLVSSSTTDIFENVIIWDVESGEMVRSNRIPGGSVGFVDVSPDGTQLAGAAFAYRDAVEDFAAVVIIWDMETGEELAILPEVMDEPTDIEFSLDGDSLLVSYLGGQVIIWDLETGEPVQTYEGATRATYSPDGTQIALVNNASELVILDRETNEQLASISEIDGALNRLIFSPMGDVLAASTGGGAILVWDLAHEGE